MEALSKLFGSENKVKIMRLFLFNPDRVFDISDISVRVKSDKSKVRREVPVLEKIGLIKSRIIHRGIPRVVHKGRRKKKKSRQGFILNPNFIYLSSLQNFLINIEPLNPKEIVRKITRLGSIKLIIIAGVFIQEPESRADILIVGDGVKRTNLEKTIKTLESEIGKELKYAYFTTEEFKYRLSMFDKLTRDILDYPHRKVLNRLSIE